jgi:hypothetical protein
MRRAGVRCFVLALILTAPLSASAWSTKGHLVVASIIEVVYLSPSRREIDERYIEKALPVIHEQLAKARCGWRGCSMKRCGLSEGALREPMTTWAPPQTLTSKQ